MTDTDQGAQAGNLGGQLGGRQPDQGAPQQNPYQIGGRNPWQMAVDLIRPPQGQPGIFSGERQDPTNTTPQNYIPAQRRSDHTMWGKDDAVLEGARRYPGVTPGPFMPYGQAQLAQVFHESAAGLANIGSGAVGPLGMQSAAYQTAFIKARMQKQEWEARMNQVRMREAAQKLEDEQRKESLAYGEIFAEYGDDKDKLKDALREHAIEKVGGRDQAIITALENGGTEAAKRVLQERDYYYLGLAKTNQQRKDEDAQAATNKFLDPKSNQPASAAATATPSRPPPQPIAGLPPLDPNVSEGVRHAAQEEQMGRKAPGVPKTDRAQSAVSDYQNALDNRMRVLTDPRSNIPPNQMMPLIRDANPAMADLTQNLLDGTSQPSVSESVKEPFATALNLAKKINPNFRRDWAMREAQHQQLEERTRIGVYRQDISRLQQDLSGLRRTVPKNVKDMDYLIELSRKVDSTGVPVLNRWINAGRRNVQGDVDVTKFNTQLEAFRRDAGQILTSFGGGGRGQFTVYAQRHMEEFLTGGETPEQLAAIGTTLKRDYENLLIPTVNELNHVMQQAYGDKFTPENADDILSALRGDQQQQNLPKPTTMEEARKLAPGTKFIDPNGVVRTRP